MCVGATGIRWPSRLSLPAPFSAGVVVCPRWREHRPRAKTGTWDCVVFLLLLWAGRWLSWTRREGVPRCAGRLHFEPQSPFCKPRHRCRRRLGQCWASDARQTPLREEKRPGLGVMVMFVRQDWHHENQERRRCAWRRGRGGGGGGRPWANLGIGGGGGGGEGGELPRAGLESGKSQHLAWVRMQSTKKGPARLH